MCVLKFFYKMQFSHRTYFMLIDYEEQKALLNCIEDFISLDLGHDLKKLGYSLDCRFMDPKGVNGLKIFFQKYGDHVYIKFGDIYGQGVKELEISVIGFKKTKKGYGTLLLSRLADIAEKYNYPVISIHAPNANSTAFGEKFGFKMYRNYMDITVADLKRNLLARKQAKF